MDLEMTQITVYIERLLMGIFLAHYGLYYTLHFASKRPYHHKVMKTLITLCGRLVTMVQIEVHCSLCGGYLERGGQWAILETDSEISLQTIINIVW